MVTWNLHLRFLFLVATKVKKSMDCMRAKDLRVLRGEIHIR